MHLNRGPLKPGPSMTIGIFIVPGFKTKGWRLGISLNFYEHDPRLLSQETKGKHDLACEQAL